MPSRAVQREQPRSSESLSRIGPKRQVVIPKAVFDQLRLSEGDVMEVTAREGSVSIKRKQLVDPESLTASEAKKVRHGLKQASDGKTRPWAKVKDELGL
jgi:AbrB family looped-hinge helix DNA binding protein